MERLLCVHLLVSSIVQLSADMNGLVGSLFPSFVPPFLYLVKLQRVRLLPFPPLLTQTRRTAKNATPMRKIFM